VEFSLKTDKPKGRQPFAEGFSPTIATVEPFFQFPSANRGKSAIADVTVSESPLAKSRLPLQNSVFVSKYLFAKIA
jgi:hypothetical protein